MVLGVVINVIDKMALESFDTLNVIYINIYMILKYFAFIISYYKSHNNVTYSTEKKK